MGTDATEIPETPAYSTSFKVHHMMFTELKKLLDRIVRILPEIEAARPRSSGINALCLLNHAVEKAKLLIQCCNESSKLYLALSTDSIVSRCQKTKNLLEKSLCQIQSMVPVMLAVEISQIVDDLRAANFIPDKYEEEAGKVVRELLQRGAAASDSMENAEMKALQTAASRLRITSSTAILKERRALTKLLEKVSDTNQQKQKILKYFLYLLKTYANFLIGEETDDTTEQNEAAISVNKSCDVSVDAQSVDVESLMEHKLYNAQADKLYSAVPPEEYKCPLSSRIMYDPVVIASGQTFERIWIQKWFNEGNDTCPKTEKKLSNFSLTPNTVMKDLISKWCMEYGINIPDPSTQPAVLQSLETSSTSIASFGSSMNDLRFSVDISNISLGSLDTSYTSEPSRNKISGGLGVVSDPTRYQSRKMDLESLSSLSELDRESQCKMVEDMKDRLRYDDTACLSLTSKNFVEPLVKFLSAANDIHDIRAQRAGFRLLSLFLRQNMNGIRYIHEDTYSLLSIFLDSEVTKEVLDVMEVLSGHSSCRAKVAASGAIGSFLHILESNVTDFQEQVMKILRVLSESSDVCSNLLYLECIPKFVPFLHNATLARHCIVVLRNLCTNQDARASISETDGCINSITTLLETGDYEDQEHALAILLALCSQRVDYCKLVKDKCDIFSSLSDLSASGSDKVKASASELLRLLGDTKDEQACFQSNNVTHDDANSDSKEKKSHKTLFRVKLPFSKTKK